VTLHHGEETIVRGLRRAFDLPLVFFFFFKLGFFVTRTPHT